MFGHLVISKDPKILHCSLSSLFPLVLQGKDMHSVPKHDLAGHFTQPCFGLKGWSNPASELQSLLLVSSNSKRRFSNQ